MQEEANVAVAFIIDDGWSFGYHLFLYQDLVLTSKWQQIKICTGAQLHLTYLREETFLYKNAMQILCNDNL